MNVIVEPTNKTRGGINCEVIVCWADLSYWDICLRYWVSTGIGSDTTKGPHNTKLTPKRLTAHRSSQDPSAGKSEHDARSRNPWTCRTRARPNDTVMDPLNDHRPASYAALWHEGILNYVVSGVPLTCGVVTLRSILKYGMSDKTQL